jgi:hypothetical protein
MAKIPNRNHRGVKVSHTGHGRTPVAYGDGMPTVEAAWRIAHALDQADPPKKPKNRRRHKGKTKAQKLAWKAYRRRRRLDPKRTNGSIH